ncbi:hypothetical protein [Taklimakanibacter albus]|uniref:Uncharacterized protein n=1 Tax=Taklimakanibacter albus TaxID=2800327 RepID=A0ACC5R6L7_9HYPH|nr:hypothetical protein [Aestuariivirga sp. YIM B02566]MBK1868260.1 hypothetical protein [Aestuariivirga sp. YIM B02566]
MNTKADTPKTDEKKIKVIVAGPDKGRWRLGTKFGPEGTPIEVTKAELDVIKADPLLRILS